MMLLTWAAKWSTNPSSTTTSIYAFVLIPLAGLAAGDTWGFGKAWAKPDIVKKVPRLR